MIQTSRVHVVNQPISVSCSFDSNLTLSNHRYAVKEGSAYTVIYNLSGEENTHQTTLNYLFEDDKHMTYNQFETILSEIIESVHKHLSQDHKVLIHCRAGINRSAAVVVGLAVKYYGFKCKAAILNLETSKKQRYRNWHTLTNCTFKEHLKTWSDICHGQ
jgi:protein-tyrosine phosphatase